MEDGRGAASGDSSGTAESESATVRLEPTADELFPHQV
jgi:hypothetical protein